MTAPRYMPLIGYAEAWSPATAGVLIGTPVYIGDSTAADTVAGVPGPSPIRAKPAPVGGHSVTGTGPAAFRDRGGAAADGELDH
jgi:hypothetical protein